MAKIRISPLPQGDEWDSELDARFRQYIGVSSARARIAVGLSPEHAGIDKTPSPGGQYSPWHAEIVVNVDKPLDAAERLAQDEQ